MATPREHMNHPKQSDDVKAATGATGATWTTGGVANATAVLVAATAVTAATEKIILTKRRIFDLEPNGYGNF